MSPLARPEPVQIVFVDGIGGRRYLRGRLFKHFVARGHACHYFEYRPSRHSFDDISAALLERLSAVARQGAYVLIGYSFGGVLARSVLASDALLMRPQRLVLVASPIRALRMCRRYANWAIFRWVNGDCGQLLASDSRMQAVGLPNVPTTCIYGIKGYTGPFALAGREPNDGMVAVAEAAPDLFDDVAAVNASHPFIAMCPAVLMIVEERVLGKTERRDA